jgi:hypothetical protein
LFDQDDRSAAPKGRLGLNAICLRLLLVEDPSRIKEFLDASEEGRFSVIIALMDLQMTGDNGTPHKGQERHLERERLSLWDLWWIPFPLEQWIRHVGYQS